MTIPCPDCEAGYGIYTDCPTSDCETCRGGGKIAVWCSRCMGELASRWQDGEAVCSGCQIIKVCACGEIWHREEWQSLPDKGLAEDGFIVPHQFRDCTCGSTLAVPQWLELGDPKLRRNDRKRAARRRFNAELLKGRSEEQDSAWSWILKWAQATVTV